jgi:hypothetical protein
MNITQIENNLQKLMNRFSKETFIYDLLLAYGLPKASITRLQKGNLNLSKVEGEICWKKKLFFKEEPKRDLHITVSELAKTTKHNERFVIVTDYKTLLAIDTKTDDRLDIELKDLPKHYDFFLPWAGMEKAQHANENPADVKAAVGMAKLFDEIKKDNPDSSPEFIHGLNVSLSRILFCFFAEDTKIFKDNQFTSVISSHTQADGSDLHTYLDKLFEVLNTDYKDRKNLPAYLNDFPYVNGGLFEKKLKSPTFTRKSRQAIIDSGELDWSAINPDIFGSMMQAVITPEHRGGLGMHYTSVPNIMKVIEPLFLNDLNETFENAKGNPKKLSELLHRLSKLKIFDPACGSGNFLIIAYKELRRLEIKIIQHLLELQKAVDGFKRKNTQEMLFDIPKSQLELAASFQVELFSKIQLNQFYGIELDDFAHEIAQLSLWLAEHQMNVEFKNKFGQTNPTLPLKEAGQITHGNACRMDWGTVCPIRKDDEIYVLGNPPYHGFSQQEPEQKKDLFNVLQSTTKLDYISCWYLIASKYIEESLKAKFAFVSTNSICQGEQVALLWPTVLGENKEIYFAYPSFKWSNNAKSNAGVTVIITGIQHHDNSSKIIYEENRVHEVDFINPYLTSVRVRVVQKRNKLLSKNLKPMVLGNMPNDYGGLHFTTAEKDSIIQAHPESKHFFRKVIGSQEFIKGVERWCIWADDRDISSLSGIPVIQERLDHVRTERAKSKKASYNKYADQPHRFIEIRHESGNALLIPGTSSERRDYFPIGLFNDDVIINNLAFAIYSPELFLFGLISSKMHNLWVRAVGGSLETRIRYSSVLCYNTFPFPNISDQRKSEITQCVFRILEEREKHPEKTLAQLYDPDKMPKGLREAHQANDEVIEKCYRARPFESDEERLEFLFKLYEKMIEEEKNKGSLFEAEKKTKKKKKHA